MMCSIIAASEYDTIGVAFITFIVDGKNRYNEQNNVRRKLQKDIQTKSFLKELFENISNFMSSLKKK